MRIDISYKTLTEVRAFTAQDVKLNPKIYLTDEGKEGEFVYDSTDTTSADNIGTIIVTTSGGFRFKRIYDKYVYSEWFGAKPNDSSFNSGAAINLAIAVGGKVKLKAGTYYSTEKILINRNDFILEGEGKFNTVIQTKSGFSGSALVAVGSAAMQPYDVTVKNLRINSNASGTGTNVSALEIDAQYNIDIDSCWMQGGDYNGTLTAGVNVKLSKHLRFTSCNFTNGVSYGVMFSGAAYDDTMFNDCQFDENQVDIIVLSTGYIQRGNILGCSFGQSYVNGTYPTPVVNKNIYAGTASTIDYLTVLNCDFFSSILSPTDNAIDITSPIHVRIQDSRFSNLKKYAIISRDAGKFDIKNNSFINNGRSRSSNVYTDATTNPDTSTYTTDIFMTTSYYGGSIENNRSDQFVTGIIEPTGSNTADQNIIFNSNIIYSFGFLWGMVSTNFINYQSSNYTLVLNDYKKQIIHPSADTTARTWTIPANSAVPYHPGTELHFVNQNGAGVITIAITSDTMRLADAGTTGNRTLAANGVATARKVSTTEWIISGTGLT